MKTFWCLLAATGFGVVLLAQTDPSKPPKPERKPTQIDSDTLEFKLESLSAVYTGNVRVNDPQMWLTCEQLTARFRTNNSTLEIESIIAETNVVIDAIDWEGRTNHATADKLVYSYSVINGTTNETVVNGITNLTVIGGTTNQTLELTGNPKLTNPLGGLSGAVIFVDLVKGKVFAKNQTTSIQSDGVKSFGEEFGGKKKQPVNQPTPEAPK